MGVVGDAACWCGGGTLSEFSDEYALCRRCGTLIWRPEAPRERPAVRDEAADLYGLNYFVEHARALGHPDLYERTSRDLSERCVFWLKALLRHRLPPARTLELGCGNGTFVATLASAGYDATGLDLSPALTDYVRRTFDVPILTGPLEGQRLAPGSIDVLVLMDVLEHLPDPAAALATAAPLLAADALLLVQTPRFDPALSFAQLRERGDAFLQQLRTREHLFLFSEGSVRELLARAGFTHVVFEPAIFSQYDMFLLASRRPVPTVDAWREALRRSRAGRMMEALVDAYDEAAAARAALDVRGAAAPERAEIERLGRVIEEIERDRAARLAAILDRDRQLGELERDRAEARVELQRLREVERAYLEVLRRLGPLRRIFGAPAPPRDGGQE